MDKDVLRKEVDNAISASVVLSWPLLPFWGPAYWTLRVILIEKSFLDQIVHVPKLFSLLHWSQNIFCFLCSSTPSHVGKFFWLQWEFQWENDQNKKNGQKSLFQVQNGAQSV